MVILNINSKIYLSFFAVFSIITIFKPNLEGAKIEIKNNLKRKASDDMQKEYIECENEIYLLNEISNKNNLSINNSLIKKIKTNNCKAVTVFNKTVDLAKKMKTKTCFFIEKIILGVASFFTRKNFLEKIIKKYEHNLAIQAYIAIHIFSRVVETQEEDDFFGYRSHPVESIIDIIVKLDIQKNSMQDLVLRAFETSMILDLVSQFLCKYISLEEENVLDYMEKHYIYEKRALEENLIENQVDIEQFILTLITLNKKLIIRTYTNFPYFLSEIEGLFIDKGKKYYFCFYDEFCRVCNKLNYKRFCKVCHKLNYDKFFIVCSKLNVIFSKYEYENLLKKNELNASEWYDYFVKSY
jgi:hypothetical protein